MYNNQNFTGYLPWPYNQGINAPPSLTPTSVNFPHNEVIRVNGENGAKAYQMAPNSSVLLLDETAPIVWLKTTDGAGYPTITGYNISPIETKENVGVTSSEYSKLDERIKRLESMAMERRHNDKSNFGKTKRAEQSEPATAE